jgi:peptide/nickel transport system substrate-binding protein
VRNKQRSNKKAIVAVMLSLGLIAAACGKKDDGTTKETTAGVTDATQASTGAADTTIASDTTDPAATTAPPATTPVAKPVVGGELVVSGDAEVAQAWVPAQIQCDSYCHQRARSFFETIGTVGTDRKVHPFLAESIEPNADSTEWTIKVRSGISFTDGTPLNADAMIENLQRTGTYLLIAAQINDIAKVPSAADPSKKELKIDKLDDMSFKIYTGKGGDPAQPLPWPGFDIALASQLGFVASPAWLKAVDADPSLAAKPIGTGPFTVESYAPRDALVVVKNPKYWRKDADGVQLPYLDKITFKVIEDAQTSEGALRSGDIDIFSDSSAVVVSDFMDDADFSQIRRDEFSETSYLLIDLDKVAPTQDVRVRCALSKALDRQEIADLTQASLPKLANGLFSPGQEGYLDDNGFSIEQDLEGAKALIADYQKDHPGPVEIQYADTADRINSQRAELIKGYWAEIGVNTTVSVIPQDQYITNALLGDKSFYIYAWRLHSGITIDQQNLWWNSASAGPDGGLALNFGRMRDPIVDENLAIARSDPDAAKRKAAAEAVNRQMAKQCYQIPYSYATWATNFKKTVHGVSEDVLPDGTAQLDGTDFTGWFSVATLWVEK